MAKRKEQAIRDKEFIQLQRRAVKFAKDLKAIESTQLQLHRELQNWARKRGVKPISRTTLRRLLRVGTKLGFCLHLCKVKAGSNFICWPEDCRVIGNTIHCNYKCYETVIV